MHAVRRIRILNCSRLLEKAGSAYWRCLSRLYSDQTSSSKPTTLPSNKPIPEEKALRSPALRALHARLELSKDFKYSTLARSLICKSAVSPYVTNEGLAVYGTAFLSFYITENLISKYPRLPPQILRRAVNLYIGNRALATIGASWGVVPETRSSLERFLSLETDEDQFGRLQYTPSGKACEEGVIELIVGRNYDQTKNDAEGAMATFVRAIIAGVFSHSGLSAARDFVYRYIIRPQSLDIGSLMSFEQPTRDLAFLCAREGYEKPVSRLMAETGRYSANPVFVIGIFSGNKKMGEGQGSSLAEARTRAAVNAVKSWYLYSVPNQSVPSENLETFTPVHVDPGAIVV